MRSISPTHMLLISAEKLNFFFYYSINLSSKVSTSVLYIGPWMLVSILSAKARCYVSWQKPASVQSAIVVSCHCNNARLHPQFFWCPCSNPPLDRYFFSCRPKRYGYSALRWIFGLLVSIFNGRLCAHGVRIYIYSYHLLCGEPDLQASGWYIYTVTGQTFTCAGELFPLCCVLVLI